MHNFHWHPGRWNYIPRIYIPSLKLNGEFPLEKRCLGDNPFVFGLSAYFHRLLLLVLGRIYLPQKSDFPHIIILHLQLTCLEIIKSTISPRTKTKTTCYVCMPCLMFFPQKNKQKKQRHKPFAHIFFILAVILGEQFGAIEVIYFPNWGSC